MEAVSLIAKQGLRAEISSAARGTRGDIDAVIKSGASTISMIIPTSDLHIECKLRKTREQVLKATEDCVTYAKAHGLKVDLLAEDATTKRLRLPNPSVPDRSGSRRGQGYAMRHRRHLDA